MKNIFDQLLPYHTYLSAEKERLSALIRLMENENRQDEANLLKIRLNIFGVFETVSKADVQQTTSWETFCQRYEQRFHTLTSPWRARLKTAQQHNDHTVQMIEEEKLSAANEIKNAFLSIKE